ncbi:bifunctional diguanylate cyclase/phosphodiesterase, partial [Photobacterium sanctipauli]
MTLYRRLFIGMLLLFILLLAGIFSNQLSTTQSFLMEQQSVEMRNAMNAVGLALSPYLEETDPVVIESVLNAIFDGSFYQSVTLEVFEPKQVLERTYPVAPSHVPNWFQQWFTIPSTTESNTITSGWLQLAKITVTSHSSIAYGKLWQSAQQLLWTVGLCFLIGMVALKFLLDRIVKQPLGIMQAKAKAIASNNFGEALAEPSTRELKDLVVAFNHMSHQLKRHFSQQAAEADILRKRAYQDPESGLGNRRLSLLQLEEWLAEEAASEQAGVMIIAIPALSQLRQANQYAEAKQLAKAVGDRLTLLVTPSLHIGRLSHSEFILINHDSLANDIPLGQLAHTLRADMINLAQATFSHQEALQADNEVIIGVISKQGTDIDGHTSLTHFLAQCDNIQTVARQHVDKIAVVDRPPAKQATPFWGKQQWLELVRFAVAEEQINFSYQKAINGAGKELHRELFTSVQYQNRTYNAGQFFPPLAALNSTSEIDRYIIEKAIEALRNRHHFVALNLASTTVIDGGFTHWLDNLLAAQPTLSQQLLFELPETVFIHH